MGLQGHVQVFLSYADGGRAQLVGLVTCYDDILPIGPQEDDDGQSSRLFTRHVALHATAWCDKVREVLHGIELGGVAVRQVDRLYLNQCVLLPAPGTLALVAENEVPDVISRRSSAAGTSVPS